MRIPIHDSIPFTWRGRIWAWYVYRLFLLHLYMIFVWNERVTSLLQDLGLWHIGYLDLTLRILLAAILGGLVGLEREWKNHAAGLRTHILVSIGSASIMLLSIYGFSDFVDETNVRVDPARLAAQVISGIGFLGAGTIMRTGLTVSGLTTAASLWVVAAIGLSVGAGFYYGAILLTAVVLINLFVLNKMEKYFLKHKKSHEMILKIRHCSTHLGHIVDLITGYNVQIQKVSMEGENSKEDEEDQPVQVHFVLKMSNTEILSELVEKISGNTDVVSIKTSYVPYVSKLGNQEGKDLGV